MSDNNTAVIPQEDLIKAFQKIPIHAAGLHLKRNNPEFRMDYQSAKACAEVSYQLRQQEVDELKKHLTNQLQFSDSASDEIEQLQSQLKAANETIDDLTKCLLAIKNFILSDRLNISNYKKELT